MEVINVSESFEKYYTPEQLQYLEERRREIGEERIRAAEAEWAELIHGASARLDGGGHRPVGRAGAGPRRAGWGS